MGSMLLPSLVLAIFLASCFWVSTNEAQTIDEARTALLNIKTAVGASNPNLDSWTSTTNPCTDRWAGVTCNAANSSIIKLNVSTFGLQGPLPSDAFSSFSSLSSLDLSQNSLTSPLPNLDNLKNLYDLNLSKNGYAEPLPTTLLNLKNIVELHIENNLFTGVIPNTISQLTKLEQLWMGNCSIEGPLPSTLTSLPITTLTAWGNNLNMELPSEWSIWVNLTYLNLRNTEAFGLLPDSWKAFTKLQTLRLYSNKITGSIPESWKTMTSLIEIRVEENDLSGTVPDWVGKISNPTKVEFKCNFLQGPIPTYFNDSTWKGNCFNNLSNDHSKACSDNISCEEFFNPKSTKSLSKGAIVGIVIAGIVVLGGLIALFYFFGPLKGSKQRRFRRGDDDAGPWEIPAGVRRFTFREISKTTKSFSESSEIGEGGFGKVYVGELEDNKRVAIKRASEFGVQGTREFRNEIVLLSRLHHRHLVRLEGFCDEKGEQILVYDYMSNGNLHHHLFGYDKQASSLNWYRRLEIALGVAQGLDYLHDFADPPVIHRDVKPSNILLDDNMIAKVADFGISKTNPEFDTHLSTRPAGTAGYLDPEYFLRRQLTTASDVYGYGVVLLELLTGQLAIDHHRTEDYNLVSWVRTKISQTDDIESIIDPRLGSKYPVNAYKETLDLAIQCTTYERGDRPKMQSVVSTLEYIISTLDPPPEHSLPVSLSISYTTKGKEPKSKGSSSADPYSDVKMDYGFSDVVVHPR